MNAKLNVSKIFIPHYKKLTDRRIFITKQLKDNGIDISGVEWVTLYDKDEWDLEEITHQHPHMFDGSGIHCKLIHSKINLSEISLDLKHRWIFNSIVQNKISDALIFEDDCIILENFIEKFNFYKSQLPAEWHLLFVGSDGQKSQNIVPEKNIYERKEFHSSRGTFCYLISFNGARLMNEMMKKINDPPDWYFNHMIDTLNVNNYWAEPPLVLHNYSFASTLRDEKYYENCPPGVR
jgi:GR25 family glycosyltransferase involved in LPS biosynthesis